MSENLSLFEEQETPCLTAPPDQVQKLQHIGGDYVSDFISETEEKKLLDKIEGEKWVDDLKRRVQHYGYRYDYKTRNISERDRLGKLPQWTDFVIEKLMTQDIFKERPDQIIVNEYQPGQGIAPHTDKDCFGPVVASLSLGSVCCMALKPPENSQQSNFNIVLEPRSLVVFRDTSRNDWKHGIAQRIQDKVDDMPYRRKLRISLTFRTVLNDKWQ